MAQFLNSKSETLNKFEFLNSKRTTHFCYSNFEFV